MSTESYYTPGVCNINPSEVAYRKKAFYLGIVTGAPLLIGLLVFGAQPYLGLILFLPVWIGAIGYLQAKNKFCVGYAASGMYSEDDEYANIAKVAEAAARKLDQARARKMNLQAFAIGIVGALISAALLAAVDKLA